ncbi:TPA: DapH/DapD/GlmU-related protein [Enterococcus faecium]
MRLVKNLIYKYRIRKDPVAFFRRLGATIGNDCEIYPSVNITEPYLVSIGNAVRINEGVHLIGHDGGVWCLRHLYPDLKDVDKFGKITIGNNVHIGTNAIIMPNVKIGDNCIIGCGAIVTKMIPSNSVAVGVPARVIESIDDYRKKNINSFVHTKKMKNSEKRKYLIDSMGVNKNV